MIEIRTINECKHRFNRGQSCILCGVYHYPTDSIKTSKYHSPFHFNAKHYLSSLRRSAHKATESKQLSEQTHLLLNSICQKFTFTVETLALAVYLYQNLQKLNPNQKFWASTCLIVAGKAGELDKNVPYLNRYQRYADKNFKQEDYELAERTVFQSMNFQLQYSTFITFLDFYMTCGVLFTDDAVSPSLVEFFQDDIMIKAKEYLKKGNFTRYKPEMLALAIIKETRTKYKIKPWNQCLQDLTGYSLQDIMAAPVSDSPLRQLTHNSIHYKLADLKGLSLRRKYQNLLKNDKTPTEKYTSISRSSALKENSYSASSKLLLQSNVLRKPSQSYILPEGYSTISTEMMNKRR